MNIIYPVPLTINKSLHCFFLISFSTLKNENKPIKKQLLCSLHYKILQNYKILRRINPPVPYERLAYMYAKYLQKGNMTAMVICYSLSPKSWYCFHYREEKIKDRHRYKAILIYILRIFKTDSVSLANTLKQPISVQNFRVRKKSLVFFQGGFLEVLNFFERLQNGISCRAFVFNV